MRRLLPVSRQRVGRVITAAPGHAQRAASAAQLAVQHPRGLASARLRRFRCTQSPAPQPAHHPCARAWDRAGLAERIDLVNVVLRQACQTFLLRHKEMTMIQPYEAGLREQCVRTERAMQVEVFLPLLPSAYKLHGSMLSRTRLRAAAQQRHRRAGRARGHHDLVALLRQGVVRPLAPGYFPDLELRRAQRRRPTCHAALDARMRWLNG